MTKVIIVGGGLSGLTMSILLQKHGFEVHLFEKKRYPFHRVCGEYVSNEARPFLESLGLNIADLEPSRIEQLQVTSEAGASFQTQLDLGGFGLSRFRLDHLLFQHAEKLGVNFHFEKILDISFRDNHFEINTASGMHQAVITIAAYGKRSNLDQRLSRAFFYKRSPYLGVKYHIKTDLPKNLIRLDNFKGGYSGVCKIEDDKFNLCYLTEGSNLKSYQNIAEMEEQVLFKNPHLKYLFKNSEFIYDKPEVINEISFRQKTLVENHLLFCGDSAGMITPLCGNGMAMAIHSAKILSETIIHFAATDLINRDLLEQDYISKWSKQFSTRLRTGRFIQGLFVNSSLGNVSVSVMNKLPGVANLLIKKTHGNIF
jgi:flavin-dependent dehydrogenase